MLFRFTITARVLSGSVRFINLLPFARAVSVICISDIDDFISSGNDTSNSFFVSSSESNFNHLAIALTVVPCTSKEMIVMKKTILNMNFEFSMPAING